VLSNTPTKYKGEPRVEPASIAATAAAAAAAAVGVVVDVAVAAVAVVANDAVDAAVVVVVVVGLVVLAANPLTWLAPWLLRRPITKRVWANTTGIAKFSRSPAELQMRLAQKWFPTYMPIHTNPGRHAARPWRISSHHRPLPPPLLPPLPAPLLVLVLVLVPVLVPVPAPVPAPVSVNERSTRVGPRMKRNAIPMRKKGGSR